MADQLAEAEPNVYTIAQKEGREAMEIYEGRKIDFGGDQENVGIGNPLPIGYWIARSAARQVASSMLWRAKQLGVSDDVWNDLHRLACEIAPD